MSRVAARRVAAAFVAAAALLLPAGASAQVEVSPRLRIPVPEILYVNATNLDVQFAPSAAQIQAGSMVAPFASAVTHAGNVVHSVQLRALAPNWASGNGVAKPASHLQWSTNGGATWTSFATTNATLVSNAPRSVSNFDVMYRVLLDVSTDQPGAYTLGFQFTVLAT